MTHTVEWICLPGAVRAGMLGSQQPKLAPHLAASDRPAHKGTSGRHDERVETRGSSALKRCEERERLRIQSFGRRCRQLSAQL